MKKNSNRGYFNMIKKTNFIAILGLICSLDGAEQLTMNRFVLVDGVSVVHALDGDLYAMDISDVLRNSEVIRSMKPHMTDNLIDLRKNVSRSTLQSIQEFYNYYKPVTQSDLVRSVPKALVNRDSRLMCDVLNGADYLDCRMPGNRDCSLITAIAQSAINEIPDFLDYVLSLKDLDNINVFRILCHNFNMRFLKRDFALSSQYKLLEYSSRSGKSIVEDIQKGEVLSSSNSLGLAAGKKYILDSDGNFGLILADKLLYSESLGIFSRAHYDFGRINSSNKSVIVIKNNNKIFKLHKIGDQLLKAELGRTSVTKPYISFSSDGKLFISKTQDGSSIQVLDANDGTVICKLASRYDCAIFGASVGDDLIFAVNGRDLFKISCFKQVDKLKVEKIYELPQNYEFFFPLTTIKEGNLLIKQVGSDKIELLVDLSNVFSRNLRKLYESGDNTERIKVLYDEINSDKALYQSVFGDNFYKIFIDLKNYTFLSIPIYTSKMELQLDIQQSILMYKRFISSVRLNDIVDLLKFKFALLLYKSNRSKNLNIYLEVRKLLCTVVESEKLTEQNRSEARSILRQIDEAISGPLSMSKMVQSDAAAIATYPNYWLGNTFFYQALYSQAREHLRKALRSENLTEENRDHARELLSRIVNYLPNADSEAMDLDTAGPAPVENRGAKRSRDEEVNSRKRLAPAGMHI